jgi:hypothetical protein
MMTAKQPQDGSSQACVNGLTRHQRRQLSVKSLGIDERTIRRAYLNPASVRESTLLRIAEAAPGCCCTSRAPGRWRAAVSPDFRGSIDCEAEVLGLTTEEAPSGQHTLTEDLCPAAQQRFEGGGACVGGGPASAASVRDQGPRPSSGGERERDGVFSQEGKGAASPVSLAAKSQPPTRNHQTSEIPASGGTSGPSGSSTPPPKTTNRTRSLACRVDALVVAFKVAVDPAVNDELDERQSLADLAGAAEVKAGTARFAVKRSRSRDSFVLENGDVRFVVDRRARGGWNIEVTTRAVYLATHPLPEAIAMPRRLAASFGAVDEARLRRFDLAGDFVSFALGAGDIERLQTTRSKAEQFVVQDKDVAEVGTPLGRALREYRDAALRVTGFAVSSKPDDGSDLRQNGRAPAARARGQARDRRGALAHQRMGRR